MSLKPTGTDPAQSINSPTSLTISLGSYNGCTGKLSDTDSEAISDSARAPRAGLRGGRHRKYTLAEKLAARTIKQPNGCWEVQGCKAHRSGHTHLTSGSSSRPPQLRVYAHRFAWEQANGRPVPAGMVVMHACDNPRCVNPDHLSLGTQAANIHDAIRKGRFNAFGRQKLNAAQVLEIRARAEAGELQQTIAAAFGIARNTVSGIVHGASWAHLSAASNVERVPHVELPVRGVLHVGHSAIPVPTHSSARPVARLFPESAKSAQEEVA
jgi:DNA-binding XRE family transcriptional regulator